MFLVYFLDEALSVIISVISTNILLFPNPCCFLLVIDVAIQVSCYKK